MGFIRNVIALVLDSDKRPASEMVDATLPLHERSKQEILFEAARCFGWALRYVPNEAQCNRPHATTLPVRQEDWDSDMERAYVALSALWGLVE